MVRILVADDEQDLAWAVRRSLCNEGYEVLCAYNGAEALALALRDRPDLVILDIVMPGLDGLEVCRRLRQSPALASVPVLFLTVRDSIQDRIEGLDAGSDDYLVKPFDLGELKARVRALLRRTRLGAEGAPGFPAQESVLVVGSLTLYLNLPQVTVGEKTVQLTPTEFALLHYLMLHPDRALSSATLLRDVWGYRSEEAASSVVRWHVKNLRAKIEPDPAHPVYICTLPHHGYMLRSDV